MGCEGNSGLVCESGCVVCEEVRARVRVRVSVWKCM